MKKVIICTMLLIIATTTFSQQTKPSSALTKQDYLKKSKNQKTFAWILVGGGVGLMVAAVATTDITDVANSVAGDNSGINRESTLFVIGGIVTVSSIPLFIAAHRNRKKGMSLSFKNETAPQIQKNSFVNCHIPSLSLKISL